MTEDELKRIWSDEQPAYQAWGELILEQILHRVSERGHDLRTFFKIPPSCRLKTEESLIDKALYRNKNYKNPYRDIEDKVGVRFVVLLLEDIETVCAIVESSDVWRFDACKHFAQDRERDPLLFTYQSVHYVLRPKERTTHGNTDIPIDTPCEVQIRTLLQHAHAELTHDAIYKSKKKVTPKVHRTVAKSMALIETTDEFFTLAMKELNSGPIFEHKIVQHLDSLYKRFTGLDAHNQKSSIIIWEEYSDLISDTLISSIQSEIVDAPQYEFLSKIIQDQFSRNVIYQQSIVLFLYWMLTTKKRRLLKDWPLSRDILETLAADAGVSLSSGE